MGMLVWTRGRDEQYAGLTPGLTPGPEAFAQSWTQERRFTPAMAPDRRQSHIDRWSRAISATMAF